MKIFIHSGFHKTGTSSAQAFLRENRETLRNHIRFFLKWRFEDVAHAAKGYSTNRQPLGREKFRLRFAALLRELQNDSEKPILLSSEELFGHLPGRKGIKDYSAAPDLAEDMANAVLTRFGPDTELTFILTTREPNAWLQSAYNHQLARSVLTLNWDEYVQKFGKSKDFDAIVSRIIKAVPSANVRLQPLEKATFHPLGPGWSLVEPFNLPKSAIQTLVPVSAKNVSLTASDLAECLALNRADISQTLRETKKLAIIEQSTTRRDT